MAWFFAIQVGANFVGPLVCYVISYMNLVRGLSAWRWSVSYILHHNLRLRLICYKIQGLHLGRCRNSPFRFCHALHLAGLSQMHTKQ